MKKLSMFLVAIVLIFAMNAQSIMLRTNNNGIRKSNDQFTGFQATFSFDQIESVAITGTESGMFSALTITGAYPAGEIGMPQLPVFKRMIAVPVGATPKIVVKKFTATEYNLEEYGFHTLFPRQPDVSKDKDPSDVPFVYDEKAYQIDEYNNFSMVEVNILGTMRGIIIGMIDIYPVQYNPLAHSIMVYNDIEVEVIFENGDEKKTEELYVNTFSPYFKNLYNVVFNSGVTRDVYDDRPDLYSNPVHMLVIADRMFEATLQPWIEWKTKKGFYMDVNYTDEIGTAVADIKTFCHNKYNEGATNGTAPTFIIFVGDTPQVPASGLGVAHSNPHTDYHRSTDLYYATVDGDYFPEMYYSRMSAQTTTQLENIIEKILYYEQYQFADPTYLDNVLLIAGADPYWNTRLAQPQISYAADNYYNTAYGYANVHKYLNSPYTGCYAHLNNVGFANYTAHCDEKSWNSPSYTTSQVSTLTNLNKYFVAMGNCCLAADFGYNECFGEAMIRAEKKGAVGYIGSAPLSWWACDFHFSVGAYSGIINSYAMPPATPDENNTKTGVYDFMFRDADFNCLSSHVFGGNLSVTYAHTNPGYTVHTPSPLYYWEAYNVLGDGSLMPYNGQASENDVSHMPVIHIGTDSYEVMAVPGSYVAISKDGILHGIAVADAVGVALVPLNPPITSGGLVDIVVTRNQYIPYIVQVEAEEIIPILCETPVNPSGDADECIAVIRWETPENIDGVLLMYNIYRDGEALTAVLPFVTEHRDAVPDNGTYVYQVAAVYEHCEESELTEGISIEIDCVGINEAQADIFQIFPNPANNSLTIKGDGLIRIELYDLQGRKLVEYNNIKDYLEINDLSKFESGVYFVRMYSENNQMATKRLIITK